MESMEFNHESDSLHEALGLSSEELEATQGEFAAFMTSTFFGMKVSESVEAFLKLPLRNQAVFIATLIRSEQERAGRFATAMMRLPRDKVDLVKKKIDSGEIDPDEFAFVVNEMDKGGML